MAVAQSDSAPAHRTRDAAETQRKILAAALHEFSAKGIAGARVDAIAARAKVNKRMLYYYFGSKEGLFRAVIAQRLAEQAESPRAGELAERFTTKPSASGRDYVRMHMWEALQHKAGKPVEGEELRAASIRSRVDAVEAQQAAGTLDDALDPAQVALMELAITMFPIAFPQLTRLVTGLQPDSDEFNARQQAFLAELAARLA
jgi:AcrR family transcriptional regulator